MIPVSVDDLIRILSLAASLNSFLLGAYVVYRSPRKELSNIFGFLCLCIGILTFGDFARKTMVNPADALVWTKVTLAGAAPLMGVLTHFSLAFPPKSRLLNSSLHLAVLYVPSAIFFLLTPTNLIVSGVVWDVWRYSAVWGAATIAFGVVFSLYIIASIATIMPKVWTLLPYRYTFVAMAGILVVGIVTNFIPTLRFDFPTIPPLALGATLVLGSLALRFGFIVEPRSREAAKMIPSKFELVPSLCYILEEDRPEESLKVFQELVQEGRPGLLISRVHIGDVALPGNAVWYKLSTLSERNAINPSDVLSLQHAVTAFVSQMPRAVVFVQGMEYLEAYLDFTIIVKILHFWSDQVAKNSASLVVSIVPGAWELAQLARLKSELRPLRAS